jgi:hypothetical protein
LDVEVAILPTANGTFALDGLISHVSEIVSLSGDRVQNSSVLVSHFDSELLTVPGIDGPNFTSKGEGSHTSVFRLVESVNSPELMSLGALVVASDVREALTLLFSDTAVMLPISDHRVLDTLIFIVVSDRRLDPFDRRIKFVD